jgi:hypothetical protein
MTGSTVQHCTAGELTVVASSQCAWTWGPTLPLPPRAVGDIVRVVPCSGNHGHVEPETRSQLA